MWIDCALLVNFAEIIRQCFETDVALDMVFVPYLFAWSDVVCYRKDSASSGEFTRRVVARRQAGKGGPLPRAMKTVRSFDKE